MRRENKEYLRGEIMNNWCLELLMMGKLRMSGWWISPPLKTQRSHRFASQYYLPTIYLIFLSYFLRSLVLVLYKALNGIRFDTRLRLDNLIICPLGFTTTMLWNYLYLFIWLPVNSNFNSKIKLIEYDGLLKLSNPTLFELIFLKMFTDPKPARMGWSQNFGPS